MDSSLIHFFYDPNTCSHCIKVLKRTPSICDTPLSRLTRELRSFTEIARKSHLLCVNRSLILCKRCTVYSMSKAWVSNWLVDKLYAQLGPGSRDLVLIWIISVHLLYMSKTDITTLTFLHSFKCYFDQNFVCPGLENLCFLVQEERLYTMLFKST